MIYGHHTRDELIAECNRLSAVHAELLAAARPVLHVAFSRELLADEARLCLALESAIAAAEEHG